MTLSTGVSCPYSSMSITPNGSVSVTCSGGSPPPPPPPPPVTPNDPGRFSIDSASVTQNAQPNATATVSVIRTVGNTGIVTIPYVLSGGACVNAAGGTVTFQDVDMAAKAISVPVNANTGQFCIVSLGSPNPPVAGAITINPSQATITVASSGPPPAPPPSGLDYSGCPAGYTPPAELLAATFQGFGNPIIQMQKSGQIVAIKPLPVTTTPNKITGKVAFGESAGGAYTPQPVTIEVSMNNCPGLIEPPAAGNRCNMVSTNGNYNSISWLVQPYGLVNGSNSYVYDLCWAPTAGAGTTYINARWSYSACAFGAQICGFAIQQNEGPY